MIKDEQVIKGQFIAEDVKIFLVYIYNSCKYYEIGSLDTINWTFTIEKILEETSLYKKNIFEYFNNQGIKVLLQKVENNLIKLGNNVIALCYDVQISENEEEDYKIMQDNQYNIKDVVSTLLSLYKFEESVKMKLELSKTQNNANSGETSDPFSTLLCTLVNQTFINEIKQLFDFQKLRHIINIDDMNLHLEINDVQVEKILKKDKLYEKFLIGKKNEFLDIKQRSSELIKIDIITFENEENKFNYPINFNVIDSKLFDKFLNIFDLKRADIIDKTEEIFIAFNYGNIVFRGMNEKCFSNHIFLLYIYSSVFQQKSDKVFYFPEIILKFQNYPDLINNFQTITKENIKEELIYKQEYFLSKYGCKICLISNRDNYNDNKQKINETDLYNNNSDTYFNKLLTFSLEFSIIYNNFYDSIKKITTETEKKIILINKKFIDEFKSIIHFKEIEEVLKNHNEIKTYFDIKDINYLSKMKQYLDRDVLVAFFNLKKNDFKERLKNPTLLDKQSKHLHNDQSNNLFYFENFQIIDKDLFDFFSKMNSDLGEKCIGANAIFSKNIVILLLNENNKFILNVGQTSDDNLLKIEYLIQSKLQVGIKEDLKKIFDIIKIKGYTYFSKNVIKNDNIDIKIDYSYTHAKIYKLSASENQNIINNKSTSNKKDISEKLKAMILLAISQNIDIEKFHHYNQRNIERVYLMNYNCLLNYKYKEISSLINDNNDIKELMEEINNPQRPYDSNILDDIISKLETSELNRLDTEIQKEYFSSIDFEAKTEKLHLNDYKSIEIYKNFILVKEEVFNEIKDKLKLYWSSQKKIDYTYNKGDFLVIHDIIQPCIFYGNIDNENHSFNIKYILTFEFESYLDEELKDIQLYGIDYYMKKNAASKDEYSTNTISKIYKGNFEIGKVYKIISGNKEEDIDLEKYSLDMNNDNLNKIVKLYNYYNEFKKNMEKNYNSDKSYFLINKNVMNDIKKDYNYDIIVQYLDKAPFEKSDSNIKKEILYVLKNLPKDNYETIIKNKALIEKRIKDYTTPEIISLTIPNTSNESVKLYDNFEILEASIAFEFINGIYKYSSSSYTNVYGSLYSSSYTNEGENYLECSLKEGKVIVNYPKKKFNNNKYAYTIGTIDNDNTFKAEYLIIYYKEHAYFNDIKNKLNNYLQSIDKQLMYGPYPLTNHQFEEIGKVIGFDKISKKIDDDTIPPPPPEPPTPGVDIPIEEYNLDSQTTFSSIFNCYSSPPLIGLDNIGATCYMNATIQCLCNIPKFVSYFKFNKHLIEKVRNDYHNGNHTLSSSFKLIIEKLWPDRLEFNNNNTFGNIGSNNTYSSKKNESYAPKEFKTKISNMNELFEGVQANDAKDLVNFLIMTLHDELNLAPKQNLNNNILPQYQANPQMMFQLFQQDFINSNKSIISDLFYGGNYNIIQCNGCGAKSYNYQTYFFFVFPLEEVRQFKMQNNYNNNFNNFNYNMNFNNNEINIYDCFAYDQRIINMTGENSMYCNFCKCKCDSQMCTYISFGPEIIIIILNRGVGIQYNVKINFVEDLNLYNFIEFKDTGVNYQLIGVITHLGGSDMSGHFIAYCKNPISKSWYQFNDSVVNEVNYANFKAEVIDYAMPYLLFYQKVGK